MEGDRGGEPRGAENAKTGDAPGVPKRLRQAQRCLHGAGEGDRAVGGVLAEARASYAGRQPVPGPDTLHNRRRV